MALTLEEEIRLQFQRPVTGTGSTAVTEPSAPPPPRPQLTFGINGLSVMELLSISGNVAGYSAGTEEELNSVPHFMWSESSSPGTAIGTLKQHMIGVVQEARQEAEDMGVNVNGNIFSTDVASQIKYVGIMVYASMDKTYTGSWKTVNNGFVSLDASGVVVMCMFVMAYIQVCFAWEQSVLYQIEAATTVAQLQQIDLTTGRPYGVIPPSVIAGIYASVSALATTAVAGTSLTVSGAAQVKTLKGGSSLPTVAGGPAAGSTAVLSMTTGSTDLAGQISVVSSGMTSSDPGGVIATVTFSQPYETVPFVTFSAANLAAGNVVCAPFVSVTETGFSLCAGNSAGLAATTHLFNYTVVQ